MHTRLLIGVHAFDSICTHAAGVCACGVVQCVAVCCSVSIVDAHAAGAKCNGTGVTNNQVLQCAAACCSVSM